jgi:hypothetical protein
VSKATKAWQKIFNRKELAVRKKETGGRVFNPLSIAPGTTPGSLLGRIYTVMEMRHSRML